MSRHKFECGGSGVKVTVLQHPESDNATIRVPGVDSFVARKSEDGSKYEIYRLYAVEKLGEVADAKEVIPWVKKFVAKLLVAKAIKAGGH